MKNISRRSAIISDDEDDYMDEDPLPPKSKNSKQSTKRKPNFSDSESDEKTPVKQSKSDKSLGKSAAKPASGSSSAKNPREKFQQSQSFRTFLNREPPSALGSKEIPQGQDNCLEGLTFVITGIFESIDRDETKNLIQRYGGKVTTNVCKSTSYLVAGRDCGQSKLDKAEQFSTKMLNEDALFDLIRKLPGKKSKYEIAAEKEMSKVTKGKPLPKNNSTPNRYSSPGLFSSDSQRSEVSSSQSQSQTSCSQSTEFGRGNDSGAISSSSESLLWVDKYKPVNIRNIIGQQGDKSNAKKLLNWLLSWRDNFFKKPAFGSRANDTGAGNKAALLSGPPGVGKTTTAQLVCKELGFSYVELNASDTRSKRSMQDEVAIALGSRTLVDFFGKDQNASSVKDSWKHCLIMDEVDGMAGNEDRGGVQELIQLIKKTKVPVICICNDRSHPKIRSLSNYCFDLRFQRPRVEQIKGAIMSMTFKEGLKIPPAALNDIIIAANQDIRQVIHNISMWTIKDKNLTYEQCKTEADTARKDLRLGAFDVCRKVFVGGEETANMTLTDKIDLFFNDYSIVPLFVQENYISVTPYASRGNIQSHLSCLSKTADSIACGDLVDGLVRRGQCWNLLPTQAIFSSVFPGDTMRGSIGQMINFPSWLGKNSTNSKNNRIIQELSCHMGLNISANRRSLAMDYLPYMRCMLSNPLAIEGAAAIESVVARLDAYSLMREDFDSIMELTTWSSSDNAMTKIDSKVKAAFTRLYNKTSKPKPYITGVMSKKSKKKQVGDNDELEGLGEDDDGAGGDSERSDEEDITQDSMIKQNKNAKALAKIKQLSNIEQGISTPKISQKSQSPKKSQKLSQSSQSSQYQKQSQSPKKSQSQKPSPSPKSSQTTQKVENLKKVSDSNKATENSTKRMTTTEEYPQDGSIDDTSAVLCTSSSKSNTERKQDGNKNARVLEKAKDGTEEGDKRKAPLSDVERNVNKKMKSSATPIVVDDDEDFDSPKAKDKASTAADGKKKSKEKNSQGKSSQGKPKAEPKPAETKIKSIASYFMVKPKT